MSFSSPETSPGSDPGEEPTGFVLPDARELRQEIRRWIPDALAGDLDPDMQELVERHVARDLELAREWEQQRRAHTALASLAEGGDGDPGFDDVFFADLHRGIVHAIHEQSQLEQDLRTLARQPRQRPSWRGRLVQRARGWVGAGQSGAFAGLSFGAAPRRLLHMGHAPRIALAAACLMLGLLIGRFTDRAELLAPLSPEPNELVQDRGRAVPVSYQERSLQDDIRKVYDEIKALPAPIPQLLPGLGPFDPPEPSSTSSEALASAEGGVDL